MGEQTLPAGASPPLASRSAGSSRVPPWLAHPAFALCAGLAATFLVWGEPVPSGNEPDYLADLARFWDPAFLAHDWSFGTALPDRFVFDAVFGALASVLSLSLVAWMGRVACWVLIVLAVDRLGARLGASRPLVTLGFVAWMLAGQGLFGQEWMAGTFEAKSLAYACLLFALDGALVGRLVRAGVLAGLSATLHPAVGLPSAGALLLTLLFRGTPPRALAAPLAWGAVLGLPGVIQAGLMMAGGDPASHDDWAFLVRGPLEGLLNLRAMQRSRLALATAAFAFNVAVAWRRPGDRGLRFLATFQACLLPLVALGVVATFTDRYAWLSVTPFRLFPVFSLLGFALAFARWLGDLRPAWRIGLAVAVVLPTLGGVPNLFPGVPGYVARLARDWGETPDDYEVAFRWISANTPDDAVFVAPPWRSNWSLQARRAQVARWSFPRYDHLSQWRARIESLVGPVPDLQRDAEGFLTRRYHALGTDGVLAARDRWGATHAVTWEDLPFPVRFASGGVRVYALPAKGEP